MSQVINVQTLKYATIREASYNEKKNTHIFVYLEFRGLKKALYFLFYFFY